MKKNMEAVSTLKGNLSKVLTVRSTLRPEERSCLENVFFALDNYILRKEEKGAKEALARVTAAPLELMKSSRKAYIKDKIIPLLENIIKESKGE